MKLKITLAAFLALVVAAHRVGAQGGTPKPKKDPVTTEKSPAKGEAQTPGKGGVPKKGGQGADQKENGSGTKDEIRTRDADESEIELPPNATEEDIRAIRGARAMLETEKRLGEILKKMKVAESVVYLRFDDIDAWPYEDGFKGMPKHIKKWDGKRVAMAGFMLPIDEVENIKTFYLVKSLWSCCYGIPPDVNGLVKINVKAKKGCAYQYDPILIVGTFRLKKVMDEDYCVCIYQMDDAVVKLIDLELR